MLSAAIAKITLQEAPKIEEQDDVVPEQSASPRRLDVMYFSLDLLLG